MAVVTISELVEAVGISETSLRERCTDEHLNVVSRFLDWRTTAPYLGLSETEIEDIEDEDRRNEVRRRKTLQVWKRKHCFKATYRKLVEVFLCSGRADHAEELCRLLLPPGKHHACDDAANTTQLCLPLATLQSSLPGECPIVPRRTGTLEEEIEILERLFLDLIDSTADGFTDANISLSRLKRCLTQLPVSTRVRHIKFLAGNLVNILNAKDIEGVFAILGLYWDFMNCGLLVEMIRRFEARVPDVKKELEKYLCRLKMFRCQTKVKEFIGNWMHTLPPYFGKLTMELDEVWMDRTLEELEEFVKEVCRKHALEPYAVLLKKAESGSVALTSAVQSSFPTRSLCVQISEMFLQKRGVLKMTFKKKCVYNIRQLILLQSLVKMWLAKKAYRARLQFFKDHVDAVVKIQAFWKAMRTRRDYKQLLKTDQPPASVIQRFLALDVLEQGENDFAEELECQRLKTQVVQEIRSNQQQEQDLSTMDIKIGLLIKNRISLKDVSQRVQPRIGSQSAQDQSASLGRLSKASQERIEAYQHLFHLLQTNPSYFAKLIFEMPSSKTNRFMENVILTVFNYAQNDWEQYLLTKFFEMALKEEIETKVDKLNDIFTGNPIVIWMVIHYTRGSRGLNALREVLGPLVQQVLNQRDLILKTSPVDVYRAWINQMEMETGEHTKLPYDVSYYQALEHVEVRTRMEHTIQHLRTLSGHFQQAICEAVEKIPYTLRYTAMRLRLLLHAKFPEAPEDDILKVVGNLLYYRYMNPPIVAPDAFDIVDVGMEEHLSPDQRRNLGSISKVLTHAAACKLFEGENAALSSLNPYIEESFGRFREFFLRASTVATPEEQFSVDEFTECVMITKPTIYISVKEIISVHSLLVEHEDALATDPADPLCVILRDLGPVPTVESLIGGICEPASGEVVQDVIREAGKQEIALSLVNRFEGNVDEDPTRVLFLRTKQLVIDLLRVQPGENLTEIMYTPATPEQEEVHQMSIRKREQENYTTNLTENRSLPIEGLKRAIMRNLRTLEQEGMVSSRSDYQEIINAIAKDIRNQHRYRQQRKMELSRLQNTLSDLSRKASFLEEKMDYYQSYIKSCVDSLAKAGIKNSQAKFKKQSFKYTAQKLFEMGVVLEIEGLPHHQFRNVTIIISSIDVCLFEVSGNFLGRQIEKVDLVFEDLLQLQYEGLSIMKMFGRMKTNVDSLIELLNDKFYA